MSLAVRCITCCHSGSRRLSFSPRSRNSSASCPSATMRHSSRSCSSLLSSDWIRDHAASSRGLPAWSQYLLAASLAAVPEARRRAREVLDAQRCRGLAVGGGALARLRASVPLAGPLMVSLVTDAERHAIALDARAFDAGGRRTSLTDVPDPNEERMLRAVIWGATVALILWGFLR